MGAPIEAHPRRLGATIRYTRGAIRKTAARGAIMVPMLADVTREDDCQQVVASALDRFGRLDRHRSTTPDGG